MSSRSDARGRRRPTAAVGGERCVMYGTWASMKMSTPSDSAAWVRRRWPVCVCDQHVHALIRSAGCQLHVRKFVTDDDDRCACVRACDMMGTQHEKPRRACEL